jgi:SAM-dependent methyltransferase
VAIDDVHLREAFGHGDAENLQWQLEHPVVGTRERQLVHEAFRPVGERMLDIGAGDGATLVHLDDPEGSVGLELFPDKLRLARQRLRRAALLAGSAYALPFADGCFDHVIVRDVIHHLDTPVAMLREANRVLAPGGRLDVLEPCRYNPLIVIHALSQKVERGELKSTVPYLRGLIEAAGLHIDHVQRQQPLPLHRLVFHRRFGLPSLGQSSIARAVVHVAESIAGRVVPQFAWAYIHLRATKSGG